MALHVLLQTISLVALLVMLVITMQMDDLPTSTAFNLMVMAVLFVAIGHLLELIYSEPQAVYIARALQLMGVSFAYPLNLYTTLLHFRRRMPSFLLLLLFVVPLLAVLPLFLAPGGQMQTFLTPHAFLGAGRQTWPYSTPALVFLLVYYGYPILCLVSNTVALLYHALCRKSRERGYAVVFLATSLVPPVFAILYYLDPTAKFNPFSMALVWCCIACGIVTLPNRVGNWASYARELALEQSCEGYILVDAANRYVESNSLVQTLFPVLQSIHGTVPISQLPELEHLAAFAADLRPGESRAFSLGDSTLRVSSMQVEFGGKYMGQCIQLRDETNLRHLQASIAKIETTDYLTGFLNERTFTRVADRDFHIALRTGTPATIIALAVDDLAELYGKYGNACLKYTVQSVSLLLRARLRKTDLVGHAEDGSFLVFLPASSVEDSFDIAEGFRLVVEQGEYEFEGRVLKPTVSVGISCLDPQRHVDAERVITEARAAMYTAQSTGGNRTCTGGPKGAHATSLSFVDNAAAPTVK